MNAFNNYGYYQPAMRQQTDERIWVQNEAGAEAYLVAAGSTVRLWDSQRPVFYEKSADQMGRQYPVVTFRYEKIEEKCKMGTEPNEWNERLSAIEERLKALEGGHNEKPYSESNEINGTV